MSSVELYSFEACPFAQRTRMVLAEKKIAYEHHEVDLYNRPDNWQEISPTGKVPLLRHNGETIYESTIINQYLDESFPERPLMPASPAARAHARIWMDFFDSKYLSAMHAVLWQRDEEDKREANQEKAAAVIRELEERGFRAHSDGPYFFGQQPSLVDFQFLPFIERFPVYEEMAGMQWPSDCTRVRDWFDVMRERDSVKPTIKPTAYHVAQQKQLLERIAARRRSAA